jgi:hypothetical protein
LSTQLRRLILTFERDGIQLRALYRSKDGPNPGTVRRRREVEQLAREGLHRALEALDGDVEMVGTSGYEAREDTLCADTP